MAYNFPVGYQPAQIYYPSQSNNYPMNQNVGASQPTQNNGIIWVQGEAGAKSYLVAPNTTVQLWDSEEQVIYLKSADASGMPSMKILDYKIREATHPAQPQVMSHEQDFVTKTEFGEFEQKINAKIAELMKGEKDESTV